MDYIAKKSAMRGGSIQASPSKSQSQRALLTAAMACGKSVVHNVLNSPDIEAMRGACTAMGAKIKVCRQTHVWEIDGVCGSPHMHMSHIDVDGSGQVLRFFSAVALTEPNCFTVTGDASIRMRRSMADCVSGLMQLGVEADYLERSGFAPIQFSGVLTPGTAIVEGGDSQAVSALLFAASYLEGETTIIAKTPGEVPWVDVTLSWLGPYIKTVVRSDVHQYIVCGQKEHPAFTYHVPGDFSSIAYMVVLACVRGVPLEISNLDWKDAQGDKAFIDFLRQYDAADVVRIVPDGLVVSGKAQWHFPECIDVNPFVDMITLLAVVVCLSPGSTSLVGARICRFKESDRIAAIATELRKMGATIQETPDGLMIHDSPLYGADCHSWHDHRVVMALVVAGLAVNDGMHIQDVGCVEKSYPTFWRDLMTLGVDYVLV